MKRYRFYPEAKCPYTGNLFEVKENEQCNLVEYEPWMDEAEKQYKESAIKEIEPTICINCEYCVCEDVYLAHVKFENHICCFGKMSYVTGKKQLTNINCEDKNNGNCPDFKLKNKGE
jgi:hypothetical protein